MPDVVLFVIRKKAGIEDYDRLVHTLWSVRRYGLYYSLVHYYKSIVTIIPYDVLPVILQLKFTVYHAPVTV